MAYKLFISSTNQFNIIGVDGCPFGVSVEWWSHHNKIDTPPRGTSLKGHNTFNLSIKDKFCDPYRTMAIQFYLLKRTTFV